MRIQRLFAPALVLACGLFTASPKLQAQGARKTLLAVFAHPDDDATIGPLLAHYAKQGARVHLVIVTSGQQGVTPHAKIAAGDALAKVREAESRAACKEYGIDEPELLGEQDGTLGTMKRHDAIVERLRQIVATVKPNAIITFGPDGVTGHADHRAVGVMMSEVFQCIDPATTETPAKLFHVVLPASRLARAPANAPIMRSALVADAYISTVVDARDGIEAAARAEACYKSQYTPEEIQFINGLMANVLQGQISLRRAYIRVGQTYAAERDVFEGRP